MRPRAPSLPLLLGLLVVLAGFTAPPASPDAPRVLRAAPLVGSIAVDGRLDEEAWAQAEVARGFVQFEPNEGAPASRETEVRVLYGPNALYVGAVLHDDPARVRRPLTRRDEAGDADAFYVVLDGFGTGRTAYLFGVTAAGVQIDAVVEGNDRDTSWDAVWDAAVRLTPEGWVVEMAIPYAMLRFHRAEGEQTWWVQFQRTISRYDEEAYWQPVTRGERGVGFIAGRLTGLRDLAPRPNVQVRPYTLSRLTRAPEGSTDPTFTQETAFDAGLDVKVGLGANVVFDATVNPDFGQVEADPAVLNLTTFETFFPERRPFFLEGTAIFDYVFAPGDGPLLYTRRIGALGRIVGAGKLTGRTRGGTAFGVLAGATSDGVVVRDGEPTFTDGDFAPDLLYATARVKREFGNRSFVGAAASLYDGRRSPDPWIAHRSVVAGADWDVRLGAGTYRWDGALTGSLRAAPEDGPLPSTSGFAFYTGLDKLRGTLTGGLGLRIYSDGFDPNDVGFFLQNDLVRLFGVGTLLFHGGRPFGPFRLARGTVSAQQVWTYREGLNLGAQIQGRSDWFLRGFQRVTLRANLVALGGVDVLESRGQGPVANVPGVGFGVDLTSDTRRHLVLSPRATVGLFEDGATAWNAALAVDWTASDRLALSATTRYEARDNVRAWAATEVFRRDDEGLSLGAAPNRLAQNGYLPLPGVPPTLLDGLPFVTGPDDAALYVAAVFGARDQRSLDTSLRASYTLRPNLSLQTYTQLFAARFRYDDFRLLAGPHDLRPIESYPRRREQASHSLILNAVARWEYRPGSTLYVVWAHQRFGHAGGYRLFDPAQPSPYDRGTVALASDTFRLPPTNVLLVKLNYLLLR